MNSPFGMSNTFFGVIFLFSVAYMLMENSVGFASPVVLGLSPVKHSVQITKHTLGLYSRTAACQIGAL